MATGPPIRFLIRDRDSKVTRAVHAVSADADTHRRVEIGRRPAWNGDLPEACHPPDQPDPTVTFRAANRREQPCSAVARVSNSQHFVIVIADGAITKYSTLPVGRWRQGVDTTGGGQCRDVERTDL